MATVPVTPAQMIPTTIATPQTYTATQTAAPTGAVAAQSPGLISAVQDQTRGTVAGQIGGLIDANSALMQREQQAGLQMGFNRGLGNSGMAIESARNAVYNNALNIATPDAASANQFALTNAAEGNALNRFTASNVQQTNLANAAEANRINILNAESKNQAAQFSSQQANAIATRQAELEATAKQFNTSQANALTINQLDQANKIQLADIQATYQNQIQGSASATNLFDGYVEYSDA